MPWLRWLAVGLSERKLGFDPRSVRAGFFVDKVALGHAFPRLLQFSPVSFIMPVLHYKEKNEKIESASSQGCTISLKAAVLLWPLLRGPSPQKENETLLRQRERDSIRLS
jgi:hypothetical protein